MYNSSCCSFNHLFNGNDIVLFFVQINLLWKRLVFRKLNSNMSVWWQGNAHHRSIPSFKVECHS
jgi:hypothetical protein